ncbi:hypothetical protein DRJ00_05370 [Candidatus Aerophobetes bacterium]|uniref:Uncharacterized protein n=1 Tax=Aerophobetes bacterium TaxID=2030807 RepID=A0A497E3I2_UNCAE|nr:MAG: hypothetical protein DRJ00_05370 [Candidatus Aerophobetes bacterium]
MRFLTGEKAAFSLKRPRKDLWLILEEGLILRCQFFRKHREFLKPVFVKVSTKRNEGLLCQPATI